MQANISSGIREIGEDMIRTQEEQVLGTEKAKRANEVLRGG
jgi:hypothetical protein